MPHTSPGSRRDRRDLFYWAPTALHVMRLALLCGLLALVSFSVPSGSKGIEWHPIFEDALALAKSEGKVVFVAVNMDGERANDEMVKNVYRDKEIRALAESTVNLVASNFTHTKGSNTCSRFGSVSCVEHRQVDTRVRNDILDADAMGFVIAPQHVFLSPEGGVILSVPYGVRASELAWCFFTAIRSVDPEFSFKLSSTARPPARLIMGGVFDTASETGVRDQSLTREGVLELIKELKKSRGGSVASKLRQLATADEPEAREYLKIHLRSAGGGKRGGGDDRRLDLVRWIGIHSPPSYWEVVVEFISGGVDELQAEAIVALEQLGSPDSLRDIAARVGKEKETQVKKNLYRALGAVALDDKRARSTLLKRAGDGREGLLQANAILALGTLSPNEDVDEALKETIAEGGEDAQVAAVLAMALTRNDGWIEYLEELGKTKQDRRLVKAIGASIGVLKGAPLSTLEDLVMIAGGDKIPRERIFGASVRRQTEEGEEGEEGDKPERRREGKGG